MNYFFLGIIYLVLLLLQLSLSNLLSIYGIKPDFILIFVVYISLRYGRLWGCISGFFMGFIQDSFLAIFIGLNALCKAFVGFLVSIIPWRITGTSSTDGLVILFFAALIHDFLYNWIYSFGSGSGILFVLLRYALPGAIYTTLIGLITYSIFPKVFRVRYEEE